MQINKTYSKKKIIDPRWFLLIAFIIFFLIMHWCNVNAQNYIELSQRWDACDQYEHAYISIDTDSAIYSMSLVLYWNQNVFILEDIAINDDLVISGTSSLIWNVTPLGELLISWFDFLSPLTNSDTLFRLEFKRIYNMGTNIYWKKNDCEITDYMAKPYFFNWIDGWLRCLVGIREHQISNQKKYLKYNLLGQEINSKTLLR